MNDYTERIPEERQHELWQYAKSGVLERDWLAIWTRFKNWQANPPMVYVSQDKIVGMHMYTESKSYMYTYFIWVHPSYRKQHVAVEMLRHSMRDTVLLQTYNHMRWKLKCSIDNKAGTAFWNHIGLTPMGHSSHEYYYDASVSCAGDDFIYDCSDVTTNNHTLSVYKKQGVVYTHPSWENLNYDK